MKNNLIEIDIEKFEALTIPKCISCGAVSRPNIMMFDDWDWNSSRTNMQELKYKQWLRTVESKCKKLAIIEIGAGLAIPTIRRKGEFITSYNLNCKLIRINPRDFKINHNSGFSISLGGLDGLRKILC